MARKHFAKAILSQQDVPFDSWMEVIRSQNEGAVPKDHVHRIAKTVLRKCDPKQYLLSHATIVASVDTYAPKGVKTGRQMNKGVQVDVRWPDFRIKPECADIINNNGDAWERSLLLSTYRSFIGAQNYLEHIQLPELSKGFIVDAVARDLGSSCYIDILVATDRKHDQLVSDILAGTITGLSMGCISLFTICSKCGNVASDDSQLCPCISYEGKHTEFIDESGNKQKIAELIGHVSVPNSNQFIEASWVRNPAFRGAVRRNFLNADMPHVASKLNNAIELNSSRDFNILGQQTRAASLKTAQQDQGGDQGGDDLDLDALLDDSGSDQAQSSQGADQAAQDAQQSSESGSTGGKKSDKIDALLEKVQEQLLSIMVDKLGEKLQPKPEDVGSVMVSSPPNLQSQNDSMIRGASVKFDEKLATVFPNSPKLVRWASAAHKIVHVGGLKEIKKAALKPNDLIVLSWIEDRVKGKNYSSDLYKLAMTVGPMSDYSSENVFLIACEQTAGRRLTKRELNFLTWKGKIASIATI
jgi:hypothetical protein